MSGILARRNGAWSAIDQDVRTPATNTIGRHGGDRFQQESAVRQIATLRSQSGRDGRQMQRNRIADARIPRLNHVETHGHAGSRVPNDARWSLDARQGDEADGDARREQ